MNLYAAIKKNFPDVNFTLRDDGDERGVYIDSWDSDLPKPDLKTLESEAVSLGILLTEAIEAKRVLVDSDWMIVRKVETGTDIPAQVILDREAARLKIEEGRTAGLDI